MTKKVNHRPVNSTFTSLEKKNLSLYRKKNKWLYRLYLSHSYKLFCMCFIIFFELYLHQRAA